MTTGEQYTMKHFARRLKVQDNVNTDYVISGRYKFRIQDPKELAKHIFEDLDPGFAAQWQMVADAEGRLLVDHVLKLENLAEDWKPLAARLSLPADLPRHNASRSAGLPQMTPAASALLEQHFARDYELFGYDRAL